MLHYSSCNAFIKYSLLKLCPATLETITEDKMWNLWEFRAQQCQLANINRQQVRSFISGQRERANPTRQIRKAEGKYIIRHLQKLLKKKKKSENIPINLVAVVWDLVCYEKTLQPRWLWERLENWIWRILLRQKVFTRRLSCCIFRPTNYKT